MLCCAAKIFKKNFFLKSLYGKGNNYKAFGELKSTVRNYRRILIMLLSMNPSEF